MGAPASTNLKHGIQPPGPSALVRSLESAADADAEAPWPAETQRRPIDVDTYKVNAVDFDETRRCISG